jgi:hypothetical protein
MCSYDCKDAINTYKNQRQIRKIPVIIFGPFGPPSSAFPKMLKLRRIIKSAMVTNERIVKMTTLNDKDPAGTSKFFP